MDKKSIIGLVLIFAIFVGYMFWVSPSKEERAEQQRVYDSTRRAQEEEMRMADSLAALERQARESGDSAALAALGTPVDSLRAASRTIRLSNDRMLVDISTLGAQVQSVVLDGYLTYDSLPLQLITPGDNNMSLMFDTVSAHGFSARTVSTANLLFAPYINGLPAERSDVAVTGDDSATVAFRAPLGGDSTGAYVEFRYTIRGSSYEVGFDVSFVNAASVVRGTDYLDFQWRNRMVRQEKVNSGSRGKNNRNSDRERYYSSIYYKTPKDKNPDNLQLGQDKQKQVKTNLDWVAFKQQYFAAIINAEGGMAFENADLEVSTDRADTARNYLTDMRALIGLPYDADHPEMHMGFYFGPTKYRDLRRMHRGYDRMLPLGWTIISKSVSRYIIIPVFNLFERFISNYGLIVIIFTLLLRLVLLPFMYKSYEGGAIMRALKPEMDALNKKYPNPEQAMQKQQAMMALQRRAGYSPMAGCLPVLFQMPVWTAMFWFYPIAIELRQKGFLWCNDLSNYDSILDFGFNIPLYGDHVSLFCLLMFGVQFFYTWYTMRQQAGTQQMPGMKFMMYFMPFMMLFIFNNQSAALCLYQLISISFTMVVMILIRRLTSEKKIRARMAAYDAKHSTDKGKKKKKSSFQQRLEEMQKMAEQMQREQKR